MQALTFTPESSPHPIGAAAAQAELFAASSGTAIGFEYAQSYYLAKAFMLQQRSQQFGGYDLGEMHPSEIQQLRDANIPIDDFIRKYGVVMDGRVFFGSKEYNRLTADIRAFTGGGHVNVTPKNDTEILSDYCRYMSALLQRETHESGKAATAELLPSQLRLIRDNEALRRAGINVDEFIAKYRSDIDGDVHVHLDAKAFNQLGTLLGVAAMTYGRLSADEAGGASLESLARLDIASTVDLEKAEAHYRHMATLLGPGETSAVGQFEIDSLRSAGIAIDDFLAAYAAYIDGTPHLDADGNLALADLIASAREEASRTSAVAARQENAVRARTSARDFV